MIKSRRLRWAGHVARIKEGRSAFKMLVVNLQERDHKGGLGVDGRKWIDSAQDRDYWKVLVNAALNVWVPLSRKLVS